MMSRTTFFRRAYNASISGTVAFNPAGAYATRWTGSSTPVISLPSALTLKVDSYGYMWNAAATVITVKDASGATVGTLAQDVPKELVLFDNTTLAGGWRLLTRAFL